MYIKRLSEVRKPHGLQVAQDPDGREAYIVRDAAIEKGLKYLSRQIGASKYV